MYDYGDMRRGSKPFSSIALPPTHRLLLPNQGSADGDDDDGNDVGDYIAMDLWSYASLG